MWKIPTRLNILFFIIATAFLAFVIFCLVQAKNVEQPIYTGTSDYDTWNIRLGSYIETARNTGYNILINGVNKYLNFGTISGDSGYGIRDNGGTIETKNSGGVWAALGGAIINSLNDINDVSTTSPTNSGDLLMWTGSAWTNTATGSLGIVGGGSQTPWTQNIDAAYYSLSSTSAITITTQTDTGHLTLNSTGLAGNSSSTYQLFDEMDIYGYEVQNNGGSIVLDVNGDYANGANARFKSAQLADNYTSDPATEYVLSAGDGSFSAGGVAVSNAIEYYSLDGGDFSVNAGNVTDSLTGNYANGASLEFLGGYVDNTGTWFGGDISLVAGDSNSGIGSSTLDGFIYFQSNSSSGNTARIDTSLLSGNYTYYFPDMDGTFAVIDNTNKLTVINASTSVLSVSSSMYFNGGIIRDTGSIGIGTTDPTAVLHVANTSTTGTSTLKLGMAAGATSYTTRANLISFNRADFPTSYTNKITNSISGTLADNTMNFELATGASTLTTVMHMRSDGRVGIGTTTPLVNFQITNTAVNATTTMELGKANQNKGTCMKIYDVAGTVKYCYLTVANAWTCSATSCQ